MSYQPEDCVSLCFDFSVSAEGDIQRSNSKYLFIIYKRRLIKKMKKIHNDPKFHNDLDP